MFSSSAYRSDVSVTAGFARILITVRRPCVSSMLICLCGYVTSAHDKLFRRFRIKYFVCKKHWRSLFVLLHFILFSFNIFRVIHVTILLVTSSAAQRQSLRIGHECIVCRFQTIHFFIMLGANQMWLRQEETVCLYFQQWINTHFVLSWLSLAAGWCDRDWVKFIVAFWRLINFVHSFLFNTCLHLAFVFSVNLYNLHFLLRIKLLFSSQWCLSAAAPTGCDWKHNTTYLPPCQIPCYVSQGPVACNYFCVPLCSSSARTLLSGCCVWKRH